jgi:hypothetical protein
MIIILKAGFDMQDCPAHIMCLLAKMLLFQCMYWRRGRAQCEPVLDNMLGENHEDVKYLR